ncbi:MAG: cysteine desulfurase/selenocysteine lyase [Salibacteraceae bacterium]|jgi:cysteine desulfurase/selenocysteine lyase
MNTPLNISEIRKEFPILKEKMNGKPLVYLDNAASSQKPLSVINTISNYYLKEHANIHRGVHTLSQKATSRYEAVREKLANWIGADSKEIIFTRGTTESINLFAATYGAENLKEGDEVIISTLEHHSNMVPWHMWCEKTGAKIRIIPISDKGELELDAYVKLLNDRTKIVAVSHISNTLGTVNDVKFIIDKAHEFGAVVLLDGAQALPHTKVNVQELDCDFYASSAHKMYGPTGIGFLYGKADLLEKMPPYHGGGEMIKSVHLEESTYAGLPFKFEAGTPSIADTIAFGAAIDFIEKYGIENISAHEKMLHDYTTEELNKIDGIRLIGTADNKAGVVSFLIGDIHPYDIGVILDQLGIAVRTGHHCTEPLMHRFNIPGTVRASFAIYNTKEEVDIFIAGVKRAQKMLS